MINLFKDLSDHNQSSRQSRMNARNYGDRLAESFAMVKHINRLLEIE